MNARRAKVKKIVEEPLPPPPPPPEFGEWDFPLQASIWVFKGPVKKSARLSNFRLVKEELPPLLPGEILTCAVFISVDPYVREVCMLEMKDGDPIPGAQIAKVILSRNEEFPVGMEIIGYFGWRNLTQIKVRPNGVRNSMTIRHIPDLKGLPIYHALGCMGLPGVVAYFAVRECIKPERGDIIAVSSAGGAVGMLAAQICRIYGARVTAFAGSKEKIKWMKENLKVERVLNYKRMGDLEIAFREFLFPEGIDSVFDTVGGSYMHACMQHLKRKGRIIQVGNLSSVRKPVNPEQMKTEPFDYNVLRGRQIVIQGFNPKQYLKREDEAINKIRDWIIAKKIRVTETITVGFHRVPRNFLHMLNGKNVGKQLIWVRPFRAIDYKSAFPPPPKKESIVTKVERFTRSGRAVHYGTIIEKPVDSVDKASILLRGEKQTQKFVALPKMVRIERSQRRSTVNKKEFLKQQQQLKKDATKKRN